MPAQTYSRAELTRFFISCLAGFLAGHLTNYSVILFAQDVWQRDALAGAGFALCFGVPLLLGWPAGIPVGEQPPAHAAPLSRKGLHLVEPRARRC